MVESKPFGFFRFDNFLTSISFLWAFGGMVLSYTAGGCINWYHFGEYFLQGLIDFKTHRTPIHSNFQYTFYSRG